MSKDKDYRNTQYCPVLDNVQEKKQDLEVKIKFESPRTRIFYNKVSDRKSPYHKMFAEIYNDKCAYCGVIWGLLPVESFEVDHFINEASFLERANGRAEAGKLENLVWACISCNRGKWKITIPAPYDDILNVDNENISKVFMRDKDFYIRICDTYKEDEFIHEFYKELRLDYQTRRLDYLALQLQGKYRNEKDEVRKSELGECLSLLLMRRNRMTTGENSYEKYRG